jgi:hypothetical protein
LRHVTVGALRVGTGRWDGDAPFINIVGHGLLGSDATRFIAATRGAAARSSSPSKADLLNHA